MRYTFDSRAVEPGMGFVALKGEKADGHDYIPMALKRGAAEIVDGLSALQAKARERRRAFRGKVIGVTGSAGKTTTKEFLKTLLACPGTEGNFNNHIGLPLTILNAPDEADFLVLEMGTNHPGEIAALCEIAAPDVGVIASVGTAHLEFFGSREGIAREKGTLFASARDFNVCSAAVNELATLKALSGSTPLYHPAAYPGLVSPLPGSHNESNLLLAAETAVRLGVDPALFPARLKGFVLPGSRWRRLKAHGVDFIDDSYNANPDSMIAALEVFAKEPCAGRRVAVIGDMFELGERAAELHRRVFDCAAKLGLDLIIGVGELSAACATKAYRTLDELKRDFAALIAPGDLVLVKGSHGMHLAELAE